LKLRNFYFELRTSINSNIRENSLRLSNRLKDIFVCWAAMLSCEIATGSLAIQPGINAEQRIDDF